LFLFITELTIFSTAFALSIYAGEQNYLLKLCRELFEAGDENNINNWKLVEKLVDPPVISVQERDANLLFERHIRNSLLFKDDEVVNFDGVKTIGNHCLHYVLRSNNLNLVRLVHRKCPRVAQIKNKILPDEDNPESVEDEPVEDHLTPQEIISGGPDTLYTNLRAYQFPESFNTENVIMPSKTWRILAIGEGSWDIKYIEFFPEYDNQGGAITLQSENAESSTPSPNGNRGPIKAFTTGDDFWQGETDGNEGCWISMEFEFPQVVKSIRIENGSNTANRVNKFYVQAKKLGEWQTQSIHDRLDDTLDTYNVNVVDWGLEHSEQERLLTITQATSSSLYQTGWEPELALGASGLFSTAHEHNPWWKGTLDGTAGISKIIITQRSESSLWFRMLHFQLIILNDGEEVYWSDEHGVEESGVYNINIPNVEGDSVLIRLPRLNPERRRERNEPNLRILTLKEVRVYHSDAVQYSEALVQFQEATASSTWNNDWRPEYAMPGNPNRSFHSTNSERNPWWQGILQDNVNISRISISNRHDGVRLNRILGFQLIIFKDGEEVYYSEAHGRQEQEIYEINFTDPYGRDTTVEGDRIMIRLPWNNPQSQSGEIVPLQLGEVGVYQRTDV
jgi:hypothetical protein